MVRARARAGQIALGLAAGAALLAGGMGTHRLASRRRGARVRRVRQHRRSHIRMARSRLTRGSSRCSRRRAGPIPLRLPQGLPAKPGARIAVHDAKYSDGAIVGGNLAMLGPPTVPSPDPTVYGPANFTPGPRKVLVLLAQINGQPAPGSAARGAQHHLHGAELRERVHPGGVVRAALADGQAAQRRRRLRPVHDPVEAEARRLRQRRLGQRRRGPVRRGHRDERRDLGQRDRRLPGLAVQLLRASARSARCTSARAHATRGSTPS